MHRLRRLPQSLPGRRGFGHPEKSPRDFSKTMHQVPGLFRGLPGRCGRDTVKSMAAHEISINGRKVQAPVRHNNSCSGAANGIAIPTLCSHEALAPYGACRLCIVEVTERGALPDHHLLHHGNSAGHGHMDRYPAPAQHPQNPGRAAACAGPGCPGCARACPGPGHTHRQDGAGRTGALHHVRSVRTNVLGDRWRPCAELCSQRREAGGDGSVLQGFTRVHWLRVLRLCLPYGIHQNARCPCWRTARADHGNLENALALQSCGADGRPFAPRAMLEHFAAWYPTPEGFLESCVQCRRQNKKPGVITTIFVEGH